MTFPFVPALLQISLLELVARSSLTSKLVLLLLLVASVWSWTLIFAKHKTFQGAHVANLGFLRMFRKATNLESVMLASEQFKAAPLAGVFGAGYQEVSRQMHQKGRVINPDALERTLQIGISEELTLLRRNLSWLATAASVSPFVGLFGTVLGIIDAFQGLGTAGSASLRAVAPGISEALIATAMGLAAAIPAAVAYNHFGHLLEELGARMDDFQLEFLNLADRTFGEQ